MLLGARVRALMIVGVLGLAAVGAGLMVLGRSQGSTDASIGPTTTGSTPTQAAPAPVAPASPSTVPGASGTATGSAPAGGAGDQLPASIRGGLASNHVVVVALFDPNAKLDDTALREAGAGAQLAGALFVPIDVTRDDVAVLNARYGVIQDPAVLVLRPPGDLVVRIDGFADRDTVAQAAANAAS